MAQPAMRFEEGNFVEERIAVLETKVDHIQKDVSEIKTHVQRLDTKIDEVDKRLSAKIDGLTDSTNKGFKEMKDESKKDLKWTMGIFGGGVVALATLMYFLFSRISVPAVQVKAASATSAAQTSAPTPATPPKAP